MNENLNDSGLINKLNDYGNGSADEIKNNVVSMQDIVA